MNDFSAQFALARERLPGNAAIDAQRVSAFDDFNRHGLPTRKHENWRYTDLRAIRDADIELLAPAVTEAENANIENRLAAAALPVEAATAVLVGSTFAPALSRLDSEAVYTVKSLSSDLGVLSEAFAFGRSSSKHPLAQLNTAFTRDGLFVDVPANASARRPLLVTVVAPTRPSAASQPRVVVRLGAHAELDMILHFVDTEREGGWTNVVVQIEQAAGSKLTLHQLQEHGAGHFHTGLVYAELAEDATLKAGFIDIGARLARNDVDVKLRERGAKVDLFGIFLPTAGQHIDEHIRIDHIAADTKSRENFRGIVGADSRGVFNGKIVVHQDAQRIDATQRSDNLLLDVSAEIDTKPELEIHADDVKCSHGATVGEIDERHLFYLQSRGIDAAAARALLTFAFANAILDEIELSGFREAVAERIAARLPQHEHWEKLT